MYTHMYTDICVEDEFNVPIALSVLLGTNTHTCTYMSHTMCACVCVHVCGPSPVRTRKLSLSISHQILTQWLHHVFTPCFWYIFFVIDHWHLAICDWWLAPCYLWLMIDTVIVMMMIDSWHHVSLYAVAGISESGADDNCASGSLNVSQMSPVLCVA